MSRRLSFMVLALPLVAIGLSARAAEPPRDWPKVTLADAAKVELGGPLGDALRRGVARIGRDPYTTPWLLADVSFEVNRIFTNYSGDVSGRFLELAALTSPPGRRTPPTLDGVLAAIARHQKPDGHFGAAVDLKKPLAKGSAPIPMLWGNARLLVGLVAAAERFHDANLLAAARRLGDFYVATADDLCSPARLAEYRASGTYGDSYTCCYFPAIESLALLHRATGDDRYLRQAERIAEQFKSFDALPVDHSHGNLCAWRGILMLYEITGKREYLDRARAKWEAAVAGGYVWPIGGVGEHWFLSFPVDEGCSESDWLRLNLDLWRFTGDVRYVDMAERLLWNQYLANQSPNGGYGAQHFDNDKAGPTTLHGTVEEWPWCCSFHGPLGLHFLKQYVAAGSERGVLVNFPVDFSSTVKASGRDWQVAVKRAADSPRDEPAVAIEVALCSAAQGEPVALWVRMPGWARRAEVADAAGRSIPSPVEKGYLRVGRSIASGEKVTVKYWTGLALEGRRFQAVRPKPGEITRVRDVALLLGPQVLFAVPATATTRPALVATIDAEGRVGLVGGDGAGGVTVALPRFEADEAEIRSALRSAPPVLLRPWGQLPTGRRAAFMNDLVVVPKALLSGQSTVDWPKRIKEIEERWTRPIFGDHLEKRPDAWRAPAGWNFTPQGLLVTGGEVGLIDGGGYRDYRFEFELVLPKEGQGITGFVVRAASENDCVMYQIQSADSPYRAPEFKTRPNTLRPHVRRNGQWTIGEPLPLPKEVVRGRPYRIAVECRGPRIEVFLDGTKVHEQTIPERPTGGVGFRAAGPLEQGMLREITLRSY